MFAEKIYMRKYFEIDSKEFPPKLVDLAYEEARAALRNDFDAIAKTQQQVQTFLGWYLAAIVSLIGILVGTLASQEGSLLVMLMTAYGIVALSVPAAQLTTGFPSVPASNMPQATSIVPISFDFLICFVPPRSSFKTYNYFVLYTLFYIPLCFILVISVLPDEPSYFHCGSAAPSIPD